MSVTVQVDSRGFEKLCRALSAKSGKPYPFVVKDQTAAVLSNCIKYSPSISIAKVTAAVQNQVRKKYNTYGRGHAGNVNSYMGGRFFESAKDINPRIANSGGKFWWREDGKYYHMGGEGKKRKWSNERWARYQKEEAERKLDLEEALGDVKAGIARSRGLGKHSWWECAQELGLLQLIKAPGYVASAQPANGKTYKNGEGKDLSTVGKTIFQILNSSPIMRSKNQGERILGAAIQSRLTAFQIEVTKGVFDDYKTLSRRYPGIFTTKT